MYYKTDPFYVSKEWRKLRKEVLQEDKGECQQCKARGKYSKANTVHHVNHLKEHPRLALEKFYQDDEGNKKRNLISLCHGCHEEVHGYRQKPKEYLIEERW